LLFCGALAYSDSNQVYLEVAMRSLETQRLQIRNFGENDWRALQGLVIRHKATEVARYDHAWPTDDESLQGIARWFAEGDDYLAVCLRASARLIGYVALDVNETDDGIICHLGYSLDPLYRGQGYGSEACRAAIEHAFVALNAAKVIAGTATANTASCRLLERLGFALVAREMTSLSNDEQGAPIAFEGRRYEMTQMAWEASRRQG